MEPEPEFLPMAAALFLCFFALGCIMQARRDIKRSELELRRAIAAIGALVIEARNIALATRIREPNEDELKWAKDIAARDNLP